MCFSASASFTAGALLAFAGTKTLKKVHKPSQTLFAAVPLIFAFQQIAEGILWVTLANKLYPGLQTVATYIFLILAKVIWPVLLPAAVIWMEKNKHKRKLIFISLVAGIIVSLYYLYSFIFYQPSADIAHLHVSYHSPFPSIFSIEILGLYLIATIVPLFISSIKKTYILGLTLLLSYIISAIFFIHFLTSVWCFFAAVLSVVIYYILKNDSKLR